MEIVKDLSLFAMCIVNWIIVILLASDAYLNKRQNSLWILLLCLVSLPLSLYLPIKSIGATPQTQRLIAFSLFAIISSTNNLVKDGKKRKILWWIIGISTVISVLLVMPHDPSEV